MGLEFRTDTDEKSNYAGINQQYTKFPTIICIDEQTPKLIFEDIMLL